MLSRVDRHAGDSKANMGSWLFFVTGGSWKKSPVMIT